MTRGTVSITVRGEDLLLHPERAVLWPRRKTVIVADTHFGKSSFFSRHGIAVPAGADDADRYRLTRLVQESGGERLIILGDFLHAPTEADSQEALALTAWASELAPAQVVVVAGNHDRGAPRAGSSIAWREGVWSEAPFCFVHDVTHVENDADQFFSLSGHIHPVMRLSRKTGMRVPVFWRRSTGLVLPSFGQFTGGFAVRCGENEQAFAVGPSAVLRIR
jgi:uncharacterized protein